MSYPTNPTTGDTHVLSGKTWKYDGTNWLKLSVSQPDVYSATTTEINQLSAITRGSILYGDSSGATARLAAGGVDTVLKSDGTDISWVAGASSYRTLISTTTISNDATVLVEGLDNSYDHYQFVITDLLISSSTTHAFYMRFKSDLGSGSSIDTTAGNYNFANIKAHSTSSNTNTVRASSNYSDAIFLTTSTEDAAPEAALIVLDIFDPAGTTNNTKGFGTAISPLSTGLGYPQLYIMHHAFAYAPVTAAGSIAAAVTGAQFYAAVGNLASGTIKLYGIS